MKRIALIVCFLLLAAPAFASWQKQWGSGGGEKTSYPVTEPDFSIVLLGDAQQMAKYPTTFNEMTTYIAAQKTAWNIKLALGCGDVVDHSNVVGEWEGSSTAHAIIRDAGIPMVIPYGNHDLTAWMYKSERALYPTYEEDNVTVMSPGYNQYFGAAFFSGQSWFNGGLKTVGDYGNYYITLDVGSYKFLIFSLEPWMRDATIAWAKNIINENNGRMVIVGTHAVSGKYSGVERYTEYNDPYSIADALSGDDKSFEGNSGDVLATKFFNTVPKLMFVHCGHLISLVDEGIGHMTVTGDYGQSIHIFRTDFQILPTSTGKFFVHLTVSPANGTITHITSSGPSGVAYASHPETSFTLLPITRGLGGMWKSRW